jgi:tRNA-modifying protein YgfZ
LAVCALSLMRSLSLDLLGMTMKWSLLDDRGVVKVAGEEAASFLHGLVTNDVEHVGVGEARYAALLTPQGKILFDFFIYRGPAETGATFLIDCPANLTAELVKRLGFYRLRAKIAIEDVSGEFRVAAFWDGEPPRGRGFLYADPRDGRLGFRAILPRAEALSLAQGPADYEAHRISLAAPKGGADFAYADAFPHDVNMDLFNGLDFGKGCYVGQEVVSRMRHRGGARKRIVRVSFQGPPPPAGAAIKAGDATIGALGSLSKGVGLALIRLDRLADAKAAGRALAADGVALAIEEPAET